MNTVKASLQTSGICPRWKVGIAVRGFYEYIGSTARLSAYACPVVNNMLLPQERRDVAYVAFPYCDMAAHCPLLASFPYEVDVVDGGKLERQ